MKKEMVPDFGRRSRLGAPYPKAPPKLIGKQIRSSAAKGICIVSQIRNENCFFCFWVAQSLQRCDKVRFSEPALAAEVTYGSPSPRRHWIQHLLHHILHLPKAKLIPVRENGRALHRSLTTLSRAAKIFAHEFVLMPNHFHLLITPTLTLERALQLFKGGLSFRAKKELGFSGEMWEKSFYDRRVRGIEDYQAFREYIYLNPMKRNLAALAEDYCYSSAHLGFALDAVPQRLKPVILTA